MEKNRLYCIEFLRIFFVFFIILGHIMGQYPGIRSEIFNFFHTKEMRTSLGVEFFFMIGGFFLYKRILTAPSIFDLIKKIYIRLIPALLFVFLLCALSFTTTIISFPTILSLTTGLSLPGEVIGFGDWYVGVYFWCSLLFIALFYKNVKQGFLWAGILSYFAFSLQLHVSHEWMDTYYKIIGTEFVRGIYSMTLGFVAAFLSEKVSLPQKKSIRFVFTLVEAYCFITIFNCIIRSSILNSVVRSWRGYLNILEIEIVFTILLICISNSLGYITAYMNKIKNIRFLSKYAYGIFLGHIPIIKYLLKYTHLGDLTCFLIIIIGAVILGVLEYHIVEKKIVPWIEKKEVHDA